MIPTIDFDTYYKQKMSIDSMGQDSSSQNASSHGMLSSNGKTSKAERQALRSKRNNLGGDQKSDDEDGKNEDDQDLNGDLSANTDIYKLRQQKKILKS